MTLADPIRRLAAPGFLCLSLLLSGCAAPPAPAPLAPPPAGLARVWFLRQFEPAEAQETPMMYVNGAPMRPSVPGTVFYRDLAPGTYTFAAATCGHDTNQTATVRLHAGEQAEFEVQSLSSWTPPDCVYQGTFYVRPISPRWARLYWPQLTYLGPG